ncbi:LacI family DNA-binding transcriptional regulator [Flavobacterium procerum]|uniref:LacI family DNA-binding transcriptional regulator n=1 Tax=Flavobacterium procerum TaxID=1455569 RepID=A0ABV6BSI3_9FLAO
MKPVTIEDIARRLSVPVSTVSKAFRNVKSIDPYLKDQIDHLSQKLGYNPDIQTFDISSETKNIGFVVPKVTTPFFAKVLRGIRKTLDPLGYKIIILESYKNAERERENLFQLEAFKVDGIILSPCDERSNNYICQVLIQRGVPIVIFDKKATIYDIGILNINEYLIGHRRYEELVHNGYRKTAWLMGKTEFRAISENARGYDHIMKKQGIDSSLIIKTASFETDDVKTALKNFLESNIEFDSIFAYSNSLAIDALRYLQSQNIPITENAISYYLGPESTNLEKPLPGMGETTAELLLDKINDKLDPEKAIFFDNEFIDMYLGSGKSWTICAGRESLFFKKKRPKKRKK